MCPSEPSNQRTALAEKLRRLLPGEWAVGWSGDRLEADWTVGSWQVSTLTFQDMQAIADALGTKDINLRRKGGWGGTDVTPGDPDEFCLSIGFGDVDVE